MNEDIIYDYPKTSCCSDTCCNKPTCGIPTNLGVYNCDKKCFNEKFKDKIYPDKSCGFNYLNPQAYQNKVACDFKNNDCCIEDSPGDELIRYNTFTSTDPRLIDVPRGLKMNLDRPPMDSSMKLSDIYCNENLIGYDQGYRTYSDIDGGQIMYYTDDKFSNPYYGPNFSTPSRVTGDISFDPMGGLEINYNKEPCVEPYQMCGLSWLNDSNAFREDLIGIQTAQIREYDWNPRYNC